LQDLLTSEQSSIIIKSLTKLPKQFDIVIYPTLVTIICDDPEAKKILSKDFDVDVSNLNWDDKGNLQFNQGEIKEDQNLGG
jgi:hypothetical protein